MKPCKSSDGGNDSIPNTPGAYALVLHLPATTRLRIGRLGTFDFPAGWYVYAGSAHGPGGIGARVNRHLRADKPPHWHIDYLRAVAEVVEVRVTEDPEVTEHDLVGSLMKLPGAKAPVPGFGARDCRVGCRSHLIRLPRRPDVIPISGIKIVQ